MKNEWMKAVRSVMRTSQLYWATVSVNDEFYFEECNECLNTPLLWVAANSGVTGRRCTGVEEAGNE